ncbi:MAG: DUF996 domain-containing protein [Candidatus Bathyarchaeota archaeon]|nr:DUF996 domain-containing protein [Candidatus Termiticorpusculum sp.]
MSLESAKNYGYIASIIFCIMPIISFIANIAVFASFFQTFGELMANPNSVNTDIFSTFTYLGVIASIGFIVGIASFLALILFLIAQYRLSKYYKEPAIFRNILYSILLTIGYIIGVIVASVILFLITAVTVITPEIITDGSISTMLAPIIIAIALFVVLTIIYAIIYALLWYRAFNKLSEKSGIDTFKTAGLLYVISMFIPFIGCIAWLFAAKGYKQLKPQQPPTNNNYNTSTYTPQSPTFDQIFCSQCGTENIANSTYCKHCGQPIQTTQTNPTI